jgi:hypothetical protein
MRAAHQGFGLSPLAAVLFLVGTPARSIAAETLTAIKAEGTTELSATSQNGNILLVEISQVRLDHSYPYKDALVWGGDVDELPQTVLTSIQISQNKKMVFVPLSAYSDLGDVKFGSIEQTKGGFAVHLHGGNTATGYDATLSISHGYLQTRTVRNREFPDERWDKTRYSFTKGN